MAMLILGIVVIIVGVVIALRSRTSQDPNGEKSSPMLGLWCFVCGLAAAIGVAMIGQASYGWVSEFDPPGWLRIVTAWLLPVGVIGAVILGTLSLRRNSERNLGITGLVLAMLSVGAFVAMLASFDY